MKKLAVIKKFEVVHPQEVVVVLRDTIWTV